MTEASGKKPRNISGLLGKAFVLASVAGVLLPMPRYAQSLDQAEYVIWLARLVWVLLLTVGICGAFMLVGIISGKIQKQKRGR